jgi:hypothetical protein
MVKTVSGLHANINVLEYQKFYNQGSIPEMKKPENVPIDNVE